MKKAIQTEKTLDFTKKEILADPLYRKAHKVSERLLGFLQASPTAWQAVAEMRRRLDAAGFRAYDGQTLDQLETGCKGYLCKNDSSILAFVIGEDALAHGFRILGAHTDSPTLKIKPRAVSCSEGVLRLATEVYGGPILNSWFDRPLSLAGRVSLRGSHPLKPRSALVDLKKPLLMLPNVAIHMNREVNEGVKIEKQNVLLPFLCSLSSEADYDGLLLALLAEELALPEEEILDYELFIYPVEAPSFCGLNDCFITSGRLDNLSMCEAGFAALTAARDKKRRGIQILYCSDNEEVGSSGKQGAESFFARDSLELIVLALGGSRRDFLAAFDRSFMISADLAHAVHPNYAAYADPTHRPRLNGGPVIKMAASQSYASDSYSSAVVRSLAEAARVPYQLFVNRSDLRGGGTIGPLSSARLPMPTADLGSPIWGMHACRETGGLLDHYYMEKLLLGFFEEGVAP